MFPQDSNICEVTLPFKEEQDEDIIWLDTETHGEGEALEETRETVEHCRHTITGQQLQSALNSRYMQYNVVPP